MYIIIYFCLIINIFSNDNYELSNHKITIQQTKSTSFEINHKFVSDITHYFSVKLNYFNLY